MDLGSQALLAQPWLMQRGRRRPLSPTAMALTLRPVLMSRWARLTVHAVVPLLSSQVRYV